MNVTDYFNPERGPAIISTAGLQKYTEQLDSYSQILTQFRVDSDSSKFVLDSAWESGDIYFANASGGYVQKISYQGTVKATLQLVEPIMVSTIQYAYSMSYIVTDPPQEDKGCWIADKGSGKIIKADKDLNVLVEVSGIDDPVCIVTDVDDGCWVADRSTNRIIKIDENGIILATTDYLVNYSISLIDEMRSYYNNADQSSIWAIGDDKIYGFRYESGAITRWATIDPFDELNSSSSSDGEEDHVGAIDVDRNTNDLYVVGGDSYSSWVLKYNSSASLLTSKSLWGVVFPYVVKAVQGYTANAIYILSDSEKWDEFGYGSSSSSSNSSSSSSSNSSSSSSSSSSSVDSSSSSS